MTRPSSPYHAPSHQANRSSLLGPSKTLAAPARCCGFTSRFVNLVLFIYNYVFLVSGCLLVAATQLYGRPEVSVYLFGDRTHHLVTIVGLLDEVVAIQLVHYTMLTTGLVLVVMSTINIVVALITSWSRSADYYYYKRSKRGKLLAAEENLLNASTLESDISRVSNWSTHTSSTVSSSRSQQQRQQHQHARNSSPVSAGPERAHRTQHFMSHCASSPLANCCHIFLLVTLFTLTLVVGVLSIFIVSPAPPHLSLHPPRTAQSVKQSDEDIFLATIRGQVNVHRLLTDRAHLVESLYEPYRCCGWNSFDDYEHLDAGGGGGGGRNKSRAVPDACCKTVLAGCGGRKHPSNIYYRGCAEPWAREMRDYVLLLAWLALSFAVVELVGLMFAICHYVQVVSRVSPTTTTTTTRT